MFVFGYLFIGVANVLNAILVMAYWIILIRALISWVNPDPYNNIVQFLYRTTEPILEPIRRFLPPMRIDISPIIAFLLIMFLQSSIVPIIARIGKSLI